MTVEPLNFPKRYEYTSLTNDVAPRGCIRVWGDVGASRRGKTVDKTCAYMG